MSGEIDLVVQKMDKTIDVLDEYEKQNGLPKIQPPGNEEELDKYLTMNRDIVEKLTVEQCGDIAYRLKQYAFYMQRLHNRENARLAWSSTQLNKKVSEEIHKYDKFMKYPNKVACIARDNDDAKKLYDIYAYAKQRVRRLTYLSNSIKDMGDTLLSLQRIKISIMREK